MQSFTGEATIPKVLLLTCFSSNANMEKPWVLVIHSAKNISKQRKIIFPNQIDRLIFKLGNMWPYIQLGRPQLRDFPKNC